MKPALYGVWLPFQGDGGRWLQDVAGFDLVTPDADHAQEEARSSHHSAIAVYYSQGHYFHRMFERCCACRISPPKANGRWCIHSNPPSELQDAELTRKLWDTDDRVAALTVEASEGREPSEELLQRLFDNDVRGLRGEAEQRAKAMR